jgi:two-component system, LytTR family, response regulator
MKIRCVVVDDEPLAVEKLTGYIQRVHMLELVGTFEGALEAMEFLRSRPADLIFLDIQMEKLSGIQFLEIMKNRPRVVITSAYDRYALKGYELDISDYLLKPISFDRFVKAVNKVAAEMLSEPESPGTQAHTEEHPAENDFIFVKADYQMQKVNLSDILFIEGMKDYLRIHLPSSRIMTLMSFTRMEKALPPDRFRRIHKSFIIPVEKIDQVERTVVMIGPHKIPIGNKYRKEFFDYLEKKKIV